MTLRDCVSPPANRLMPAARVGTLDANKLFPDAIDRAMS
jgi:hypothetical protein